MIIQYRPIGNPKRVATRYAAGHSWPPCGQLFRCAALPFRPNSSANPLASNPLSRSRCPTPSTPQCPETPAARHHARRRTATSRCTPPSPGPAPQRRKTAPRARLLPRCKRLIPLPAPTQHLRIVTTRSCSTRNRPDNLARFLPPRTSCPLREGQFVPLRAIEVPAPYPPSTSLRLPVKTCQYAGAKGPIVQ
jgi:hypothetical protein